MRQLLFIYDFVFKKIFTIFSISLFFLNFFNSVALGAVSRVVDNFQVTQRIPTGIVFNPDGTKMFISGMSQNRVYEFDLTTAFDISEATRNSNECNHQPKDEDVVDLILNSDGTKLFLVGSENNILLEYSLSTAYDVSTCSYENTFFSGGGLDPRSMAFNTNGTKLFIYDQTGNYSVKQYSLNSAYNLTNATLEKQYTGTASETLKEIAEGIGMNVLSYSLQDKNSHSKQVVYEDSSSKKLFYDILRESDIISLHARLSPETQYLISSEELSFMKPTAFLVNTARGGLIKEKDLVVALQNSTIHGAALDVFDQEPITSSALKKLVTTRKKNV